MWADVVEGLQEDESETADLVEESDSEEPNHIKARQTRRQPKTIPRQESRRSEGRRSRRGKKKANEGFNIR